MAKQTPHDSDDKREFFRVNHDVLFEFKVVDADTAENFQPDNEFDDAVSLSLLNELRKLDHESTQTLRLLTEKNRLLGDYLQTLSNKIDLIARHTLFANNFASPASAATRINVSEDGIAFMSERALYKDSYLAIRLIFLPSYSPVISFAKVLRCEAKEKNYQIGAQFFRTTETQRQELSRQVLKAQVQLRKNTKSPGKNPGDQGD